MHNNIIVKIPITRDSVVVLTNTVIDTYWYNLLITLLHSVDLPLHKYILYPTRLDIISYDIGTYLALCYIDFSY